MRHGIGHRAADLVLEADRDRVRRAAQDAHGLRVRRPLERLVDAVTDQAPRHVRPAAMSERSPPACHCARSAAMRSEPGSSLPSHRANKSDAMPPALATA